MYTQTWSDVGRDNDDQFEQKVNLRFLGLGPKVEKRLFRHHKMPPQL